MERREIVLNKCYGGFGISKLAAEKMGMAVRTITYSSGCELEYIEGQYDIKRDDPKLVAVVKELKEKSFGLHAKLAIVSIPADIDDWEIFEYDGMECLNRKLQDQQIVFTTDLRNPDTNEPFLNEDKEKEE